MALAESLIVSIRPLETPLNRRDTHSVPDSGAGPNYEQFGASWLAENWERPVQATAWTEPYLVAPDATFEFQRRLQLFLLVGVALLAAVAIAMVPNWLRDNMLAQAAFEVPASDQAAEVSEPVVGGGISAVFAPEVRYWEPQIVEWSSQHNLDPNLAATIMQIESCGDPGAVSAAGAQGLFQVMPFHFQPGEDSLDPDTNAYRGLSYFADRLAQTEGDIGRAFAGYNGGHVAAAGSWDSWVPETQNYYTWSTGIYSEIESGLSESPTLQKWLAAGGAGLCAQAARRLDLN